MRGYGLPTEIDFNNVSDDLIDLFGLKNGDSEQKRNGTTKRAIRKSLKHAERFRVKQQINKIIHDLEY